MPGLGPVGEEVPKQPGPQYLSLRVWMAFLFRPAGDPLVALPTCSGGPWQGLGQEMSRP